MILPETMRERAESVEKALRTNILLADRGAFLDKYVPVEEGIIEDVYEELVKRNLYNEDTQQWTIMSDKPTKEPETALYPPLQLIILAIRTAYFSRNPRPSDGLPTLEWCIHANKAPHSHDKTNPAIRPDLAGHLSHMASPTSRRTEGGGNDGPALRTRLQAQQDVAEKNTRDQAEVVMEALKDYLEEQGSKKPNRRKLNVLLERLSYEMTVWWSDVAVPLEGKRDSKAKTVHEALMQLCRYISLVLETQLDRRFVPAILLCGKYLSLWHCDRTGLLGSKTSIHIHEEPRLVIQVFLGLIRASAERLGFDPTMEIVCRDGRTRRRTDPTFNRADLGSSIYLTKWRIMVPNSDDQEEWYRTAVTVNASRAQELTGRGTLVWMAKKETDKDAHQVEGKAVALKQAWRPVGMPSEAAALQTVLDAARSDASPPFPPPRHISPIACSADIKISGVDANADLTLIRDRLSCDPYQLKDYSTLRDEEENAREKKRLKQGGQLSSHAETRENPLFLVVVAKPPNSDPEDAVYEQRVLTRTLMPICGRPLRNWLSLTELVSVFHGCLEELGLIFFDKGSVHRDISTANIMIHPETNDGLVIDFDYVKTVLMKATYHDSDEHQEDVEEIVKPVIKRLARKHGLSPEEKQAMLPRIVDRFRFSVISEDGHSVTHWCKIAIDLHAVARRYAPQLRLAEWFNTLCCTQTIAAHPLIPNWDQPRQRRALFQTGTPAFMSVEMLYNRNRIHFPSETAVHRPIHDIESLFWVLVYICLTCGGDVGIKRPELLRDAELNKETDRIRTIIYCLFDGEPIVLHRNKLDFFQVPERFETHILKNIHPHFEPLKPLLWQWWLQLNAGFALSDAFDDVSLHHRILSLLEDTKTKLAGTKYDHRFVLQADSSETTVAVDDDAYKAYTPEANELRQKREIQYRRTSLDWSLRTDAPSLDEDPLDVTTWTTERERLSRVSHSSSTDPSTTLLRNLTEKDVFGGSSPLTEPPSSPTPSRFAMGRSPLPPPAAQVSRKRRARE